MIVRTNGIVPLKESTGHGAPQMKGSVLMATAVTGVAAASAVAAYMASTPKAEREDCPGKIVCPITGELICADQCPAEVGKTVALPVSEVPSCCAGKD